MDQSEGGWMGVCVDVFRLDWTGLKSKTNNIEFMQFHNLN